MVIVDKSIDELLNELSNPMVELEDDFVIQGRSDLGSFMTQVFDEGLCSLRSDESLYPLVREAALNAAEWGNNFDSSKKVVVKLYSGLNGWLLQISDSGKGFDYQSVMKDGYFQNKGMVLLIIVNQLLVFALVMKAEP